MVRYKTRPTSAPPKSRRPNVNINVITYFTVTYQVKKITYYGDYLIIVLSATEKALTTINIH